MNLNKIKDYLFLSIDEKYKEEFNSEIIKLGLNRATITAITLSLLEIIILSLSLYLEKENFFYSFRVYYGIMYVLMILVMIIFLVIFSMMKNHKISKEKNILRIFYLFTAFILLWNSIITLLDQISYGEVTVYIIAVIGIGVVSIYKSIYLLIIYIVNHMIFLISLPYFQSSSKILFGHYINTTVVIVISWVIQTLIYKSRMYDFTNRKIIQEKNNEMNLLYKKLKKANEELKFLAERDGLTGLYNRLILDKLSKIEWQKSLENLKPLTVIMIDIDFFKAFNDNYGHQAGDECIKKVAELLKSFFYDKTNIVARYGGEEFIVIFKDIEKEEAYLIVEKIRKEIEKLEIKHEYSSVSKYVTVSLGMYSSIPSSESSIEEFIKAADDALYAAKNRGRNKFVVFE